MNFQNWLRLSIGELSQSESPRLDAEILLKYITGKSSAWILAFSETVLTTTQINQLSTLLARRKTGEPIAYLTGECEFWSLPIYVSPDTFIPRPDTECLVERVLSYLPSNSCRILDLGTGTGAIALALASECPNCQIIAVDSIPNTLQVSKLNIERLKKKNVQILQSNWFNALSKQTFDIIVSNPPYIAENDPHLLQGDVRFEPRTALVAAEEGLQNIRHIVMKSRFYFRTTGWLFIEHGWMQGKPVRSLFRRAGFRDVITYRDYGGNDRLTLGRWTKYVR